jgi:WXG100 family type VII secretion target
MADLSINSIDAHLPTIAESADYIRGVHGDLLSDHETLKTQIQKLLGDWNSNGSLSYSDAQHKWDLAAEGIYEVLRNLHIALGNVHTTYSTGDNAIARQWSV